MAISSGVRSRRDTMTSQAKRQGATHLRVCGAQSLGCHLVHGGRVPAARVQLLQQPARRVFEPVEDVALRLCTATSGSREKRWQRCRIARPGASRIA